MLITVREFRQTIQDDINGLVQRLQSITGRYGDEEANAWRISLPKIAKVFASPALSDLHLYFGDRGNLSLEYRLPGASSWCDLVLLGKNGGGCSAVVVELKNWVTRGDQPGPREGLMVRQGQVALHPSDQVKGYRNYCQHFHSAVLEIGAQVHGCVFFTGDVTYRTYLMPPNDKLAEEYPCFSSLKEDDVEQRFPAFLENKIREPNETFALSFEKGRYRQDRNFVLQVAKILLKGEKAPLELLDRQRLAYSECLSKVEEIISKEELDKRHVIIVDGPPGSGKSIIAAKVWANLVEHPVIKRLAEEDDDRGVVMTTTSQSQNSNWRSLFKEIDPEAAGIVIKANEYIPCSTHDVGKWKKEYPDLLGPAEEWRKNLPVIYNLKKGDIRTPDKNLLVSVVDEAHALINPEHSDARGQFGFAVQAGPQGYHIIRSSVVSIFFADVNQSFRERETTTIPDIKTWAAELDAEVTEISLAGSQFRCGGSSEYVDWVEKLLEGDRSSAVQSAELWKNKVECRLFKSIFEMENALREKINQGHQARFVASYARPWKTKECSMPHYLAPDKMDFHIRTTNLKGELEHWSRIWNYTPDTDYTLFIKAPEGTPMGNDPLSEVGCPYAVRGFDFDYIGVLWLSDLKWQDRQWEIDLNHVHETGLQNHKNRARHENGTGQNSMALAEKIKQAYRILLTRAIRGVYFWFEDEKTADFVRACLEGN